MKLADVIQYEGDNSTLIWKHESEDFNTLSQLIVHESQEAVFYNNGQALDLFGPGRHTLKTQNLPIIGKLQRIPTDGVTPFHCEVYFINKTEQMAIKWGTDSKVGYVEPTYGFPLSIGASGEMSLRVEDSRRLLVKLVGTEPDLSQAKIVSYFRGILMTRIKTYIAQVMKANKISIFEVDELLNDFSEALRNKLYPDFMDYGVALEKFFVTTVVKPDGEPNYERFKAIFFEESVGIREEKLQQQRELIRQQTAAQKIIMESAAIAQKRQQEGYSYQQERGFDVAQGLAENEGVGNFSSAGIGLGMMAGVGGGMGAAVAGLTTQAMSPIMSGIPQTEGGFAPVQGGFAPGGFENPSMIQLKQDAPEAPAGGPASEQAGSFGTPAQPAPDSMTAFKQKLDKLVMMKEAGLLSDEELAAMKSDLLKQL